MSKRGKKKKGKDQPAVKKLPVSEPRPLPSNFPGGLKVELLALFLILAAFAGLGFNASRQESVTVDEFAHLPAGISFLRTGDFRLYSQSPPLLRMLAALPLAWDREVRLPLANGWQHGNHWEEGYEFMYANSASYPSIFTRARLMTVLLGMVLVGLVWWWARTLYGPASGLFAAALAAFCPNLMAHSGLVTTDLGAALALVAVIYGFWKFCQKPSAMGGMVCGLLLGMALLCKFTSLMLVPMLMILGLCYRLLGGSALQLKKAGPGILLMVLISWLAVNTGYLWKGVGMPLGAYAFESQAMKDFSERLPARTPVILPFYFVKGFDLQTFENESKYPAYFLGKISRQGWRSYYLVAMAVKMTLWSLLLILAATVSLAWRKNSWKDELFLLLPPLGIILGISLFTNINLGFRYILPAIPFLYIFSARLVSPFLNLKRWLKTASWLLLIAHLLSNLLIYPDYLAYFNLAAGGPKNGGKILVDSNLDWGQGLIGLKKYMDRNRMDKICLAYFGRVDPAVYQIKYQLPYADTQCDSLAVSASFLAGLPFMINDHGKIFWTQPEQFGWLDGQKPAAAIGYSILVFDLGPNRLHGLKAWSEEGSWSFKK